MARKKVEAPNLETLIPQYAEHKSDLDALDKVCKAENAEIKKIIGEGTKEVAGYKATVSISQRESVDEELMLAKLAQYDIAYDLHIIKTKEYIDTDALEKAIYQKQLTQEILSDIDSCRKSTTVTTLRVTKMEDKK